MRPHRRTGTGHLTQEDRHRIRTLYFDAGLSKKEIGIRTGFTFAQIRYAVANRDLLPKGRTGRPPVLTKEQEDELVRYASTEEGRRMSYLGLANTLFNAQYGEYAIRSALRRRGITRGGSASSSAQPPYPGFVPTTPTPAQQPYHHQQHQHLYPAGPGNPLQTSMQPPPARRRGGKANVVVNGPPPGSTPAPVRLAIRVGVHQPPVAVTAAPLTAAGFAPFGDVVDNPRPELQPAAFADAIAKGPDETAAAALGALPHDPVVANQGSAIKYQRPTRPLNFYPLAPSRATGFTSVNLFVCAARKPEPAQLEVGDEVAEAERQAERKAQQERSSEAVPAAEPAASTIEIVDSSDEEDGDEERADEERADDERVDEERADDERPDADSIGDEGTDAESMDDGRAGEDKADADQEGDQNHTEDGNREQDKNPARERPDRRIATFGVFPVHIMERHPFTTQTFVPMLRNGADARYLVIVAPSLPPSEADAGLPVPVLPPPLDPTSEQPRLPGRGLPDLCRLRAFVATGGQAVTYGAGTWHAPMVALGAEGTSIDFFVLQFANGVGIEDCQEVVLLGQDVPPQGDEDAGSGGQLGVSVWVPEMHLRHLRGTSCASKL